MVLVTSVPQFVSPLCWLGPFCAAQTEIGSLLEMRSSQRVPSNMPRPRSMAVTARRFLHLDSAIKNNNQKCPRGLLIPSPSALALCSTLLEILLFLYFTLSFRYSSLFSCNEQTTARAQPPANTLPGKVSKCRARSCGVPGACAPTPPGCFDSLKTTGWRGRCLGVAGAPVGLLFFVCAGSLGFTRPGRRVIGRFIHQLASFSKKQVRIPEVQHCGTNDPVVFSELRRLERFRRLAVIAGQNVAKSRAQ